MSTNYLLYDYIININFQLNQNIPLNTIFNNASYIASVYRSDVTFDHIINDSLVNVNTATYFNLNQTLINILFMSNSSELKSTNNNIINKSAYNTIYNTGGTQFSYRLLEIVATKIFGSAKLVSIIANQDKYFDTIDTPNSLLNKIFNSISNSLNNFETKQSIINIYNQNIFFNVPSYTRADNFTFQNTAFEFPFYFTTTLQSNFITPNLNNGLDYGGTIFTNSSINVPILIRFVSNR
jgi:hypothetical protein